MPNVNCNGCGKEFYIAQSVFARSKTKKFYCSRECQKTSNRIEKTCVRCGKKFEVVKSKSRYKYCSRECYFGEQSVEICRACGKTFRVWNSNKGKIRYCSKECRDGDSTREKIRQCMLKNPTATRRDVSVDLGISYDAVQLSSMIYDIDIPYSCDSFLEGKINSMLSDLGIRFSRNDRTMIAPQELDFLIREKGLAIETNDIHTHNSTINSFGGIPKHRNYHRDKTLAAQQAGIQLLHVWEWQVTNPIKFEIVKSMVAAKLGIVDRVLRASKCDVVDISTKEAKAFVERCHIQGYEASREAKALVHDGSVVAVMCFRGDELTRFCSELGTRIHGGFSKLMKAFGKSCITTFSFNDYSDGGVYERMGFKRTSDVDPRYWWVRGDDVLTRRSCQKKLISARWPEYYNYQDKADNRTEKELMEGLGYVQMYDSGKVKWELSII